MVTNMKFGECLRCLLSIFDISNVKLSRVINVDDSLVNRWVNEKRTPSYNTDYIEKISEYISGCILNSFQEQHLDELFFKVCGDSIIQITPEEKIKKILFQSQGYSIECRKRAIKESKSALISKKETSILSDHQTFKQNDTSKINAASLNSYDSDFLINLSSEDKIIIGYKNVLYTGISLLESISDPNCSNDTIYISFNSNMYISNCCHDLICFRNAILKAINKGWNILFLLKFNNKINNIVNFIDFALPLINTVKFHPYYFKKYNLSSTYEEFIVIPEIAALLGLPNNLNSEIDAAFYFKNKIAVNIFKNKLDTIILNHTKPLITYHKSDNDFNHSKYEDVIGNRILYKRDFSNLMLPEDLYKKLLLRKNLKGNEISTSLIFHKKRLEAFLSNIYSYKYTDIYHIDCMNTLIRDRKFFLYLYDKIEEINLEVEDVISLLNNIITLLDKHDNYNIAFISSDFNNTIEDSIFYCAIKERVSVMLETYKNSRNTPEVRLSIEEPTLVKAFEVYFEEILDQIAPINKDKYEIKNWIENQINLLKTPG
jgi:hypothetical protein